MKFSDYFDKSKYSEDSIEYQIAVMQWFRDGGLVAMFTPSNKTIQPAWDWKNNDYIPICRKKRPFTEAELIQMTPAELHKLTSRYTAISISGKLLDAHVSLWVDANRAFEKCGLGVECDDWQDAR